MPLMTFCKHPGCRRPVPRGVDFVDSIKAMLKSMPLQLVKLERRVGPLLRVLLQNGGMAIDGRSFVIALLRSTLSASSA